MPPQNATRHGMNTCPITLPPPQAFLGEANSNRDNLKI